MIINSSDPIFRQTFFNVLVVVVIMHIRLAYAVWMLDNILESHPKQSEVFVMCDIASTSVSI